MIRTVAFGVVIASSMMFTACFGVAEKMAVGLVETVIEVGNPIPECDEDYTLKTGGSCKHCENNDCIVCSEGECEEVDCSDPENTETCDILNEPTDETT